LGEKSLGLQTFKRVIQINLIEKVMGTTPGRKNSANRFCKGFGAQMCTDSSDHWAD
jgi:hypothetical protein